MGRRFLIVFGCVAAVVGLLGAAGAAPSSLASPTSGPLIEFWDGTSWTQQVGPNPNGTGWYDRVTAISATDVWAVGKYFTHLSEPALAAHWDGSSWKRVAMPTPRWGVERFTGASALAANDVWVVGDGGGPLVEHWNGDRWRIMPSPSPGVLSNLNGVAAVSPRNVWAVGQYKIARGSAHKYRTLVVHWNGTTWKRIASPNPGLPRGDSLLSGVHVVSYRNIWAVGSYVARSPSGHAAYQTLILHWNGKKWTQVRSINPGGERRFDALYGVDAPRVGRNNVWAVGTYSNAHGLRLPLVEWWNGHDWRSFPARSACPNASTQPLTDIAVHLPDDVWAAGAGTGPYPCDSLNDTTGLALVEHFDGLAWTPSPIVHPSTTGGGDALYGIAAATRNAVWAVGRY